jgi:hypothetical protein
MSLTNPRPVFTAPTLTAAMPLTVGQITKQLTALAPDAAETRERIRHWTREGLLSPIASHHSGTGKHAAILRRSPRLVHGPPRTAEVAADQPGDRFFFKISHQAVGGRAPVTAIHEGAVRCDPAAAGANDRQVRDYRVSRPRPMPSAARFSAGRPATAPMSPGRPGPGPNQASNNAEMADEGRWPRRRRPPIGFVLQKWSLSRCCRRDRLASLGRRSSASRSSSALGGAVG